MHCYTSVTMTCAARPDAATRTRTDIMTAGNQLSSTNRNNGDTTNKWRAPFGLLSENYRPVLADLQSDIGSTAVTCTFIFHRCYMGLFLNYMTVIWERHCFLTCHTLELITILKCNILSMFATCYSRIYFICSRSNFDITISYQFIYLKKNLEELSKERKEEICLSPITKCSISTEREKGRDLTPMTKAPMPSENKSEHKHATKKFDYTTIAN